MSWAEVSPAGTGRRFRRAAWILACLMFSVPAFAAGAASGSAGAPASDAGTAAAASARQSQRSGRATILSKISAYLNGLQTVKARFVQVGPDGGVRTGTAILQRPGKMRFEYDKPDSQLLVAGFGLLVYHDPELNQTTNIPLSATPLGILLAKHVTLSGPVTVTKISTPPGEIEASLIRTGKAAQGHLTLVFSTNPVTLRQWRVTDAQGRTTQVTLYNLHKIKPLPNKDFEFVQGYTNSAPKPAH